MTASDRVGAALEYLGTLAEANRGERTWNVGAVAWRGWTEALASPRNPEVRKLKGLVGRAELQAGPSLVRAGWVWLVGAAEVDGRRRRVKLPLFVRPLNPISLRLATAAFNETGDLWPSMTVNPELVDADADEISELGPLESGQAATIGLGWSRMPTLQASVRRILTRAGIGGWSEVDGQVALDELETADGLRLVMGWGFFLGEDPLGMDLSTILNTWRHRQPDQSVLEVLYGGESASRAAPPAHIVSPLPLNTAQRAAVESAAVNPLTVVSGPPGTGKTHCVVAAAIDEVARGGNVLVATQSEYASRAITEILDRYPMVNSLQFGSGESAVAMGNRLAHGVPPPDEDHDVGRLTRRMEEIDEEIRQSRSAIAKRLEVVGEFEAALALRDSVPLWLVAGVGDGVDLATLSRLRSRLDATGLLSGYRRDRARRRLARILEAPHELDDGQVDHIIESLRARRLVDAALGMEIDLEPLLHDYRQRLESWRRSVSLLLEASRRTRARRATTASLNALATALRAGGSERRRRLLDLGTEFLDVVPMWVGTLAEIERMLPVVSGLFDLVVLDEASQISQERSIPALARARRALIAGDARQLRHVSFVSGDDQAQARRTTGVSAWPELVDQLDIRRNSTFDAAAATTSVIQLDEHFRSAPHIIGFSDRRFYDGRLRLMTQHPGREDRDSIQVMRVDGERQDGVVVAEVDAVVDLVAGFFADGRTDIGVVSPFRAQADAIEEALLSRLSLEAIQAMRLRVGTVHAFQGSERGTVIISIGLGSDPGRELAFLQDEALFNVMVTRARDQVIVVTALPEGIPAKGLLADYFRHAGEPPLLHRQRVDGGGWHVELGEAVAFASDIRVITDYEVAGWTVDLAVGTGREAFGVDAGLHPDGVDAHIERRLALHRAGWDVIDCHQATWFGRTEEAAASLAALYIRRQSASQPPEPPH